MEMGSISLTESGSSSPPNSSNDSSLNGLKFGRKIYFEDPTKPAAGSTSATSGSGSRKGRGGGSLIQGGQPPRCQVEGCKVDLSDAKAYYSRHKVCGMHSKSPQVVVGGIQQRFCQQCSRFHQLAEFDQGKRSCRRRLAGHNERRRKPPPGSLLSSRYGRLSSSIFENGNRSGGFLVDFTAYPRHGARDSWPPARSHERGAGSQATGEVKFLVHHHHPWQGNSENPPPGDLLLQQGSGNAFPSTGGIPSPGECYTAGVVTADSSCALSLLSNQPQPWGSRSDNTMMSQHQQTAPHGTSVNHHFPGVSLWAFKADEAGDGPNSGVLPDLGLSQFSQPLNSHFSGEVELPQQGRRQYMELDHSRAFDSSHQVHWSL